MEKMGIELDAEEVQLVKDYQAEHGIASFEEALHAVVISFLRGCKDTQTDTRKPA